MKPNKRLGRGLSSLLGSTEGTMEPQSRPGMPPTPPARMGGEDASASRAVEPSALRPNPFQPRTQFREEPLEDLKASIREHGILQPIVVRRAATGFEVIAGERRLRAARALGLPTVPVVIREASDEDMQTLALVENLQREDLNAIEQARALRAMMANFGWTQEDVASRVGKARTTIANMVRILDLPTEIHGWVEEGALSGAHARALLQAKGDERRLHLAKLAIEGGWSVREVERHAAAGPTLGKRKESRADPFIEDLEQRLRVALGVPATIRRRGKGGRIELRFHDSEELDRLLAQMGAR